MRSDARAFESGNGREMTRENNKGEEVSAHEYTGNCGHTLDVPNVPH